MKYERHDNLILADWTLQASLLSAEASPALDALESLVELCYDAAQHQRLEAVLWIQKVPVHDFHWSWQKELTESLLRDALRMRLRRLYRLRQCIQFSPVPWFAVTEHDCEGPFLELFLSCHRRFVFQRETHFGFPEMALGSMPCLGWLAAQAQKRPRLLESFQKQSLIRAEDAVQLGLIDAAISWKDWRKQLLTWANRQIKDWEREFGDRMRSAKIQDVPAQLGPDKAIRDAAHTPIQHHVNAPKLRDAPNLIDFTLLDTAAHFYSQAQYATFIRQNCRQRQIWGEAPQYEIIFLDINEAITPLSIATRLLNAGFRLCFFAQEASVLRQGLEVLFAQLDAHYRRSVMQHFERQIAYYVGETPKEAQQPTLGFGAFRNFQFDWQGLRIRGWALSAQSMSLQTAEISGDHAARAYLLRGFFNRVHPIQSPQKPRPSLYFVKSLALQALVRYAELTGDGLLLVLEQLRGLGWLLLGSERHWVRFMEYRSLIQSKVKVEEKETLGTLSLDRKLLYQTQWRSLVEKTKKTRETKVSSRGPGFLQIYLVGFCQELRDALVQEQSLGDEAAAELYLADALGFPENWGQIYEFESRTVVGRPFFQDLEARRLY